ncbi:hypothetical protein R3P38DRAFT_3228904 [Favolaschia claudopus]|uniref:Uncharacterized protein n=1 Tax=Favolaschia claudopus TaxID=2862362 RepID=A0AAV9ZP57_9AGAR
MHWNTSSWSKLTESSDPSLQAFIVDGTQSRLASLAAPANYDPKTSTYSEPRLSPRRSSPIIDWGLSENLALEPSLDAQAVAVIAQELLDYVNTEVNSGDEDEERFDGEEEMGEVEEPMVSVFSQRQLDLFIWLLKVSNVDDVPSVKSMQELNAALHNICGTESIAYDGALAICPNYCTGNVEPQEDSGKVLEEARQCKRWLEELPAEKTTPMARFGNQDYCIHEPAMLRDGTLHLVCKVLVVNSDDGQFWRVVEQETEVSEHEFMENLPDLRTDFHLYGWPDPSKIHDVWNPETETLTLWSLTDPCVGNAWRVRAQGSRVLAFPIWLYCDDTSGNLSKKWNEHFPVHASWALARASREGIQHTLPMHLKYCVGVLDKLENSEQDGSGLGISEFACHIGMRGKLFCRACWVKESDALEGEADKPQASESHAGLDDVPADSESEGEAPPSSPAGQAESDAESDTSQTKKKRGKRVKETLEQMVDRVKSFMKVRLFTVLRQYSEPPFPDWWGTGLRDKLSWTSL